ncbi:hypothetical protein CXF68_07775 [Tenacibaculum sp. Bg11-29]|uniref:KAP family P-loop NTPase fold protein n=1 Tax=Tenacibaculum sp. Bg11-29 TaxID=2058306 RepID=UPI000C32D149|nr:P-loop NTPase fold protein [Tenacibaculum sp. Bg11-29]PKH50600.1 hypothetical protein CXF68_07775 [Tenacibaculum sp. Bg11-29]
MSFINSSPIDKNEDDFFNFRHYAKKVQKIIQNNSDNTEPLTIGIYGKWGEGKTSFLNLVEKQIDLGEKVEGQKGILKYHFNPWRYSTEDGMLFDFFNGLSKMMFVEQDTEVQKIAKRITEYYNYIEKIKLKGKVGLATRIIYSLANVFKKKDITLDKLIEAINTKLKNSKYKIVVFIDDIDRLDKEEIYTILKLIKLNANFSNFVYIIALDKDHVAKAIGQRYGEGSEDGELFLEKIINIPIHLPKIETTDFKEFFKTKLEIIIKNLGFLDSKKEEFKEIGRDFRVSYFNNGREIIRVLNSFFVSAFAIGEEVNLRDLLWIEYLKVKYSNVFNYIKKYNFLNSEKKTITIVDFFGEAGGLGDSYEILTGESNNIIRLLFPDEYDDLLEQRLEKNVDYVKLRQKGLRVNSIEHFEKYFSYHMEGKVSVVKNRKILQYLIDKNEKELESALIDLRDKYNLEAHRFYSVIEDLIIEDSINHMFFYDFIFSNLNLFPKTEKDIFGSTYLLKMIELIASILDKNNNSEGIIELAKKLSLYHLCYFTRTIELKTAIKKELEKLIVRKTKEEYLGKPIPFFYDLTKEHSHYKMMMSLWEENDKDSFNKYIDNNTKSFQNILKLIRNFPAFSTTGFFIDLEKQNYEYMTTLIDVDLVYKRIEEHKPELIKKIDINYRASFSMRNRPSEQENVEQFIYHYKKDKNLLN